MHGACALLGCKMQHVIALYLYMVVENSWPIIIKSTLSVVLILVLKYSVIRNILALSRDAVF